MSTWKQIKPTEITENVFDLIGTDWMLVTAKSNGKSNTMTASWGGLGIMWGKPVAFVVIRPQRYTKEFVDASNTFSLTFFSHEYNKQLGYLGRVSGREEDKITNSGLTLVDNDETPYFEEGKLVLKLKKLFAEPLQKSSWLDPSILEKWYPEEDYHVLYIAEVEEVLCKMGDK